MVTKTYNVSTGCSISIGTDSQCNERQTRGLATAMQCQKRHHHLNGLPILAVVLFLAFLRMLTLQEFKKTLGKRADSLTEAQIEELRVSMYKFASIFFDKWLDKVNSTVKKSEVVSHNKNGNYCSVLIFVPAYA